jgi:arylsulfatase A-like enzyme
VLARLLATAALLAAATRPATSAGPNIVIVNIDDLGWGDFGAYGSEYAQTPNIDQLAAAGTRFTQFYAGAPICSPSRASLFTGQYAARSGINSFLDSSSSNLARDNADSLKLTAPSIARTFQDAGYATGHFGKWHLGGGRDVGYAVSPTPGTNVAAPRIVEYGYDEAWTQFEGLGNRIINVANYGGNADGVPVRPSAYFNGLNQSSDARGTGGGLDEIVYLERQYNATFMVNRAIDFIDESRAADPNKPFFMNVWLDETHTPHHPPAQLQAKYDALYPQLSSENRSYLAVLEYADQQIGRLISHIDQQGLGEETLILVMSDNGPTGANDEELGSNGPFRGSKGSMFEGGFRQPLIARWNGHVAAGRTDDDTVIWMPDLFPTLAGIADVATPAGVAFDGENLSGALLGNQSQARTTSLFWNMNRGDENRHSNPNPNGAGAGGQEAVALRRGDWKLLLNSNGTSPELYDLSTDVGETNNLAVQQPGIASQLAAEALSIRYSTPSRTLPDTVSPIVRLKAETLAGLGNGATVASWADAAVGDTFSGSLSQSNASQRPTVITNALNGRAVVQFDGDDALLSSTTNRLPAPSQGITVIAVATSDGSGATAERLGQIGKSSGAGGSVVGFDVSSTAVSEPNGGAGFRFNDGAALYDTPIRDPGFHIVVWQVNEGQSYADAKMYVDGTLAANTFTGSATGANSLNFSGSDLELLLGTGRSSAGALLAGDSFSGQVAEFLVFNNQLSKGDINLVANYLSTEYALPFAYDVHLPLFDIDGLSWMGGQADFAAAWNAGDGAGGPAAGVTNPFAGGVQNLFLGNNGVALLQDSTSGGTARINSMRIGTAHAGLIVAGTEGNGALRVSGSRSLTIGSGSTPVGNAETGDLIVGEGGYAGTVEWNSTGTMKVEGRLRIGQGGVGVVRQDGGTITAGDVGGTLKFVGVGIGSGGDGEYRLNNGRFLPGGGLAGSELRHVRVGTEGAVGRMFVGDGVGAAGSARIESNDDLAIGHSGGSGMLAIESDGAIVLRTSEGVLQIANGAGSTGLAIQRGGSVSSEGQITIGQGVGSVGEYRLEGGVFAATGVLRVGAAGGKGALRVRGNAQLTSTSNLIIGQSDNSGSEGRVELTGSQAAVKVARLENHLGADETIRWVADAQGVTPLVVAGSGGVPRVQLQDPVELAANVGANGLGTLRGDGIALSLDLSAFQQSGVLTLIDNQTTEAITGFFENGATGDLYEEGESIVGTGFNGSVVISYLGGTGNDVVLQLTASAIANADFDANGVVDGADFLAWQRGFGSSPPAVGDADGNGTVDGADLAVWKQQFGAGVASAAEFAGAAVPEPGALTLLLSGCGLIGPARWLLRQAGEAIQSTDEERRRAK